jgi:hypothetical protein
MKVHVIELRVRDGVLIFPLRVAVEYVPCHFDTARRTLRVYKD